MSTRQVIACDVGGTGIKAGLVDAAGQVRHAVTVPTPLVPGDGDATAAAVLAQVAALATALTQTARSEPSPQTTHGELQPRTPSGQPSPPADPGPDRPAAAPGQPPPSTASSHPAPPTDRSQPPPLTAASQPPPPTDRSQPPPLTAMNGSLGSSGQPQSSIHPHREGSGGPGGGGEGGGEPPVALGVVVPGLVDAAAGMARYSENLGWRDVPFAARLAEATDLPIAFDHDVRAAGAAEQQLGAARGHRDVAFVPIGTGISAALVLDGRPYAGGGWAGEIGHLDVGSGLACVCGSTGCLETVASAAAIARRYTDRSGQPVRGALDVTRRMGGGDPDAVAVWDEAADALAFALAAIVAVAAPELIVIGGGLSGAGDVLLDALRGRLEARLSAAQRPPQLCLAELGDQAGLLGAALLAWRQAGVIMRGPA